MQYLLTLLPWFARFAREGQMQYLLTLLPWFARFAGEGQMRRSLTPLRGGEGLFRDFGAFLIVGIRRLFG